MERSGKSMMMIKNAQKSAPQPLKIVKSRYETSPPPIHVVFTCHCLNLILNRDLQKSLCKNILLGAAIVDCQKLVDLDAFVDICVKDTCHSSATEYLPMCSTISEYSHQCAHAGGKPGAWRTPKLCGKQSSRIFSLCLFRNHCFWPLGCVWCGTAKKCPFNMQYSECGTSCPETCSHPQKSQACATLCVDGCFCPAGKFFRFHLLHPASFKSCVEVQPPPHRDRVRWRRAQWLCSQERMSMLTQRKAVQSGRIVLKDV